MLAAVVVDIPLWFIVVVIIACLMGVLLLTLSFFVIRRLHELHTQHNKIDGELFIADTGECFAEYGIPIPEIVNRKYILLKVNHIGGKEE